jgi:3'(2'),5'-bisphosphate nucleotidase
MLVEPLLSTVAQASARIMEIYNSGDFDMQLKSDKSPVTAADLAANDIIVTSLQELTPAIAIVSEEMPLQSGIDYATSPYWLIDPVDGTKEFLKHHDEFTVNVALIDQGVPVFGIVAAPALGITYYGGAGLGAFKQQDGRIIALQVQATRAVPIAAISRSHQSNETLHWLQQHDIQETRAVGSSLKICYVADHSIDIYPRLAQQHEWDIAAADAVLRAAGGCVTLLATGQPYVYGKPGKMTSHYLAGNNLPDQLDYRQPTP